MLLFSTLLSLMAPIAFFSGAVSLDTTPHIPVYGVLSVSLLIMLISLREILLSSKIWNECLDNDLKTAIVPLFLTFVAIVAYIFISNISLVKNLNI